MYLPNSVKKGVNMRFRVRKCLLLRKINQIVYERIKMNCKVCENLYDENNPNVSFFRFPSNYNRCREWARRCDILHLFFRYGPSKFYKSFRICSDHFETKHIVFDGKRKKLTEGAVPKMVPRDRNGRETDYKPKENKTDSDYSFTSKILENLCRFCAEEGTHLIDIYSIRGKTLELEEKIKVFPITINKNDRLPLKICSQCIVKISKFYDFVKNCMKADVRLKTILGIKISEVNGNNSTKQKQVSLIKPLKKEESDKILAHTKAGPETVTSRGNALFEKSKTPAKSNIFLLFQNDSSSLCKRPEETTVNNTEKACSMEVEAIVSKGDTPRVATFKLISQENSLDECKEHKVYITKKYTCKKCFKTFDNEEIFMCHEKAHYLEPDEYGRFMCRICNKEFSNRYRLNEHNRIHTGECPFKCSLCDKKFHKRALLRQHLLVHDESRKRFVCPVCCLRSRRKGNLIQHMRTHYKVSRAENVEVTESPPQTDSTVHEKNEKEIEDCQTDISTNEFLKVDGNANQTRMKLKLICGRCQLEFLDSESLKTHFRVHTPTKEQKKGTEERGGGGGIVSGSEELTDSDRCQKPNERNYLCGDCGSRFKRKDTLKNHSRIHTGERPFLCKSCGFAFKQRGDCLKHEKNHRKEIKVSHWKMKQLNRTGDSP